VISPSQRPLPDNTQHSQHTDIYAHGGIRTHNSSKRGAADRSCSPRGHWDMNFISRRFGTLCLLLLRRQVLVCRMNSNLVHSTHNYLPMKMEQSVPKRRHIKFRRRGITQKKAYKISIIYIYIYQNFI